MDNKANSPITVIAQWDYIASKDSKLTFSKGDKITVLNDDRDDGWCFGKLEKNNNEGWFNMAYINTDPTNVNQICFCRQPLTKYAKHYPRCLCCCKEYQPNEMEFYWCSTQCLYRKTTGGVGYTVCTNCYETQPAISSDDNANEHSFMKRKIDETLNIIKKEIEQCQDNQQTRQHMVNIYQDMYEGWIKRLNESEFAEIFMSFYSRYLEVVKNEIDLAELELKEDIVWNKV
eukprot:263757_1